MSSTAFPTFTIEGYPRVGANRELKKALESFWAGRIDEETFTSSAHSIRLASSVATPPRSTSPSTSPWPAAPPSVPRSR